MTRQALMISPHTSPQQQALEWQVILWSGEVTAEQQQLFEAWLSDNLEHQQAWAEMQRMQQKLQSVPQQAINLIRDKQPSAGRRRLLQMLGFAAVAAGTVPVVRQSDTWQALAADYRTQTGQREEVVLADGSQLIMNTATSLDIAYSASERKLILHEGEIHLKSAPHMTPNRPLRVQTRHGVATALGTSFNVRLKPHETRVSVYEGAMQLQSHHGQQSLVVPKGMQAAIQSSTMTSVTSNGNENAWLKGKLIAEQQRLGDFLDELSRYRAGVIRCDDVAANLMVSGVFPLQDTDRVLQSLAEAMPLRIDYFSRYWVMVHAA
ncbi:FecR domain-containing protein [Methylophilus methylotrophus]|uniref:FecR domain-containing protein n=1 Tax=Methylophilus methylotrophus TaxID=17 RepID=UPI000F593893|nr:FecR domain-containing protein [Methylophilus methylotrophus]